MRSMPFALKLLFFVGVLAQIIAGYSVFSSKPQIARAQSGIPIGGFFAPGVFDIFNVVPFCGLTVTVVGPNPGVFVFMPVLGVYNYFPETFSHVAVNTVGLGEPASSCGLPTMVMLGSSLLPGPQ